MQEAARACRTPDAELWLSVRTHRHPLIAASEGLDPSPVDRLEANIDVMVGLESLDTRIRLRVMKDHDAAEAPQQSLLLDLVTLHRPEEDQPCWNGAASALVSVSTLWAVREARGAEATSERWLSAKGSER